jgi:hypothetical protein
MKQKIQNLYHYFYQIRVPVYIVLLCILVLVLSTKGITDESIVSSQGITSSQGDIPRYLINGVYFYDLIGDLPIINPFEHASRYFARYPTLTLGHHPLLLGIAEVPFYAVFGISIFSARLTIVFFMLLAAIAWFLLVRAIYGDAIAFLSTSLFVTTPFIVKYSRIVMSEIPTLALIILSTYLFYQYCESDKKLYVFAAAVSLALSVYAKHTAVFIFPVIFFYLLIRKGFRSLIRKEVLVSALIIGLLVSPFVLITLKFSHYSLAAVKTTTLDFSSWYYFIKVLWQEHLTLPILVFSLIAIAVSVFQRDKRAIIFLLWIVSCYLMNVYLGYNFVRPGHRASRFAIFWIPPYCLFAAITVNFFRYRFWKVLTSAILVVIAGYQFSLAFQTGLEYVRGYEEAAQYIVAHRKGASVLYSNISVQDPGFFVFFVRKHDPDRELIVLRANKILATSEMSRIVEERIRQPEDIYEILQNYGVGYIVMGDRRTQSRSIEWLREEVQSEKFILRQKITLRSNKPDVNNLLLSIYEYKDYTPPKKETILDMNIPLMGDSIKIRFGDLLR